MILGREDFSDDAILLKREYGYYAAELRFNDDGRDLLRFATPSTMTFIYSLPLPRRCRSR